MVEKKIEIVKKKNTFLNIAHHNILSEYIYIIFEIKMHYVLYRKFLYCKFFIFLH